MTRAFLACLLSCCFTATVRSDSGWAKTKPKALLAQQARLVGQLAKTRKQSAKELEALTTRRDEAATNSKAGLAIELLNAQVERQSMFLEALDARIKQIVTESTKSP